MIEYEALKNLRTLRDGVHFLGADSMSLIDSTISQMESIIENSYITSLLNEARLCPSCNGIDTMKMVGQEMGVDTYLCTCGCRINEVMKVSVV